MTAQGKIPKPHILYIVQTAAYLLYGPLRHSRIIFVKLKLLKEPVQGSDAHIQQLRNGLPPYLHIIGLLAQAASLTLTANGLAGITGQQILVLYLVAHSLHHFKKRSNACKHIVAAPKQLLLLLGKLSIRLMDREIKLVGTHNELLQELAHNLSPPARNCPFINRQRGIWNHKALINSYHTAVTATGRAGTNRIIVAEHQFSWFLKTDTVSLKHIGEAVHLHISTPAGLNGNLKMSLPLIERCLHRVQQTGGILLRKGILPLLNTCTRCNQVTVHHNIQRFPCKPLNILQHCIHPHHTFSNSEKACISGILNTQQFLHLICILHPINLRKDICCKIIGSIILYLPDEFKHIICRMALHLLPCYR